MYFSRAMMSIGMMALIGNALLNVELWENLKNFSKKKHLMFITGYFFIMLLSILWSDDKSYFAQRMQIMIPFLILPFSFFSVSRWDTKWYDLLMLLFIVLNLGGIAWSMYQYLQQKEIYDIGYGFSKLIPTPFKNDHIRFSIAVVMSLGFSVDLFSRHKQHIYRILLVLVMMIDVLYIHVLAAKTGIVALYLVMFLFVVYLLFSVQYKKAGIIILLLFAMLPFLMYAMLPSFKNKIGYFRYSLNEMRNVNKQANVSDEGRLISYQYAWELIKEHPLIGVGVGDVYQEMKLKYERDFPTRDVTVLLPHNQFLMAGVAIGFVGMIYLMLMQFFILKIVKKNDFLYFGFCLVLLFSMLIEPLFETQYGTCIFLFFLLLLMKRSKYYLA
jgi:O-antigen ligase